MSHPHPAGLLAAYNSLTDKHLAGYFNNTRIRRHLLRSGLITRNGRILSEKEYKVNIMKRDHQKCIRECIAQAIFRKVLDMERHHQMEIKRKLESSAKKERVQRLKGEHTRRFVENNIPILSPHPPAGPKTNRGHSVRVDQGHPSPLTLTAPRPYTAPGNMQPPVRLQPLLSNYSARNASKVTLGSRLKTSFLEKEAPFPIGGKKAMMKFRNSLNSSQRVSTYHLPDITGHTMPVPPPLPPRGKALQENKTETWRRRRRLRPITVPNGLEPLFTRDSGRIHKTSLHSNAVITMVYLGKNVHLSYDDKNFQDEIKVYQQHCGGENLCVYKGKLLEKDTFQFISKRHHGFPFSLTFFLNGMQVNRLSSCCEFKHRRSSRLGGKGGLFGFVCVEKASPCYRCIIAMGLDRKTSSVKPRKDKSTEKREELRKGQGKLRKGREHLKSRTNEIKGDESSVSAIVSAQDLMGVREVRTAMEEMEWKRKPGQDVWEEDQENTFKYDYEEDFEVEEEKQDDKANEDQQAYDQMNEISKSPTDSEKDNLGLEKETEISSQKTPDAEDIEDEDIGCLDSEEEKDKQDIKTASSISSRSHPYSSESDDESSERDRKAHTGSSTSHSTRSSSSVEWNADDRTGKPRLPAEVSLPTEMRKKETTKGGVVDRPLLTEASREHVLQEEMEEGTREMAEEGSGKPREPASREAKDECELWEGGLGEERDRKAGVPGVEKGVGPVISEALGPGFHSHSDITSDMRRSEEGSNPMRELEIDSSGAPNWNYVLEKRAACTSDEKSNNVERETHTLEKKVVMEEDESPRPGKGAVAVKQKTEDTEVPLEEKKETAKPGALAGCMAAAAEGSGRPREEERSRRGRAAGGRRVTPRGAGAAGGQAAGPPGLLRGCANTSLTQRPSLSAQQGQQTGPANPEMPEAETRGAEREAGPRARAAARKGEERTPAQPGAPRDPAGQRGGSGDEPPGGPQVARDRGDPGPERGEAARAEPFEGEDAAEPGHGGTDPGDAAKASPAQGATPASAEEPEPDAHRAETRAAAGLQDEPGLAEESAPSGRMVTLPEAAREEPPEGTAAAAGEREEPPSLEARAAEGTAAAAGEDEEPPSLEARAAEGTAAAAGEDEEPPSLEARAAEGTAAAAGEREEPPSLEARAAEGTAAAAGEDEEPPSLEARAAEGTAAAAGEDEEPPSLEARAAEGTAAAAGEDEEPPSLEARAAEGTSAAAGEDEEPPSLEARAAEGTAAAAGEDEEPPSLEARAAEGTAAAAGEDEEPPSLEARAAEGTAAAAGEDEEPPSLEARAAERTAAAAGEDEERARKELEGLGGLEPEDGERAGLPQAAAGMLMPSKEMAPARGPTLRADFSGAGREEPQEEEEGRPPCPLGTREGKDSLAGGHGALGGGAEAVAEEGPRAAVAVAALERREKTPRSPIAGGAAGSRASLGGAAGGGLRPEAGRPGAEGGGAAQSAGEALGTGRRDAEGPAPRLRPRGDGGGGGEAGTCGGGQGPWAHGEPARARAPLPADPHCSGTREEEEEQREATSSPKPEE